MTSVSWTSPQGQVGQPQLSFCFSGSPDLKLLRPTLPRSLHRVWHPPDLTHQRLYLRLVVRLSPCWTAALGSPLPHHHCFLLQWRVQHP